MSLRIFFITLIETDAMIFKKDKAIDKVFIKDMVSIEKMTDVVSGKVVFDREVPRDKFLAVYDFSRKETGDKYLEDWRDGAWIYRGTSIGSITSSKLTINATQNSPSAVLEILNTGTEPVLRKLRLRVSNLPAGSSFYWQGPGFRLDITGDGEHNIEFTAQAGQWLSLRAGGDYTFETPVIIEQLPEIDHNLVRDLTGNGYDLRVHNMTHKGMSGRGGYLQDFTDGAWIVNVASNVSSTGFKITSLPAAGTQQYYPNAGVNQQTPFKIRFKISGVLPEMKLYFGTGTNDIERAIINADGEYEYVNSSAANLGFRSEAGVLQSGLNIIVEQLPEYPGAMVFDGEDDYARSVKLFPAFENNDYSIIADFDIISTPTANNATVIRKQQFYLLSGITGDLFWYNVNGSGSARVPVSNDFRFFTNNLAFTPNGDVFLNNRSIIDDIVSDLFIAGAPGQVCTAIAIRHLLVANGANLSYEACVNALERAREGTLVSRKVRYIRDWASGSSVSANTHWYEIQALDKAGNNIALGKPVTSDKTIYSPQNITDGNFDTRANGVANAGLQYVQIDLEGVYDIESVRVLRFPNRTFHDTKLEISDNGVTWHTVFDSAIEGEYVETAEGRNHVLI